MITPTRPRKRYVISDKDGRSVGAIATVKNGSLLFILPGGGVSANGKALPEFAITRSSGDRHSFRIADRDAYTGVQAYWLDLEFGKRKSHR